MTTSAVPWVTHRGTLGDFTSHAPIFCTTGAQTSITFIPSAGSTYYLVVPRTATFEGSYGTDGAGAQRPQGVSSCLQQTLGACE